MNTILIILFALVPNLSSPAASPSEPSKERKPDPTFEYLGGMFRATEHTWRADLGYGLYSWDRVTGYESMRVLRLRVNRRFHPLLGAELGADYTWRNSRSGPLKVSNQMLGIGANTGLEYWTGALRLSAMAGGGALVRTSEISDDSSNSYSAWDIQPFANVRGGVGTVISELIFVGFDADIRLRPSALDWNLVLSTGVVW